MYDNGVAGIHITGSNNFTFEATIGSDETEGEGNVGRTAGQQPIEVIVESSSLVTFQDMRVSSDNGEFKRTIFAAIVGACCMLSKVRGLSRSNSLSHLQLRWRR